MDLDPGAAPEGLTAVLSLFLNNLKENTGKCTNPLGWHSVWSILTRNLVQPPLLASPVP
jgi:hypothetical protein